MDEADEDGYAVGDVETECRCQYVLLEKLVSRRAYPIVAILVAAANATSLPKLGKLKQKLKKAPNQIVRIGELNLLSICAKKLGIPPSRANANIIREFEVREKRPAKKTQMIIRQKSTTAPSGPKTSTNIWRTGLP